MAVPLSQDSNEQEDEARHLSLAQSYYQMSQSAAWKDLQERVDGLVLEAQQDHFSSKETDPLKIVAEKLRWQQRLLTQQAILNIVDSELQFRKELMAELKAEGEVNGDQSDIAE